MYFFRKGKTKALTIVEKDMTDCYINLFISMGDVNSSVDLNVTSEFVCRMYAESNLKDVNEARYKKMKKLIQMTGKIDQVIKLEP